MLGIIEILGKAYFLSMWSAIVFGVLIVVFLVKTGDYYAKQICVEQKRMKIKINTKRQNNLITYGIVILAYIIVEAMLAGGQISSLMKGTFSSVSLCDSEYLLNLVVGILGELSLWTCRIYVCG